MREFKFRAYSKSHNIMFTHKMLKNASDGMFNIVKKELGKIGLDKASEEFKKGIYLPIEDEDLVFMQYTGLKDRNGKEIYEDDIVEFCSLSEDGMTLGVVSYCEGMYIIGDYILRKHIRSCIVKGNIYENEDLLK